MIQRSGLCLQKAMPIRDRILSKEMAGIPIGKERLEGKTWEDVRRKRRSSVMWALAWTLWLPARCLSQEGF